MTDFKSKFLYLILGIRIIMFLSALAMICMFLFLGAPSIWSRYSHEKAIPLTLLGTSLFTYLSISIGYSLMTQRFNLIIKDKKIFLKDIFLMKTTSVTDNIKGYSISAYSTITATKSIAGYFRTTIIYFKTGEVIEFPQFLYWNYKFIALVLDDNNVEFLGRETFIWKNLLFRRYQFK